jgi:hypothetical protein
MGDRQGRRRTRLAAAFVDQHLPMAWAYAATLLDAARAHHVARDVVGGVDPRLLEEDDAAALRRLLLVRSRRAVRDEQQSGHRNTAPPAPFTPSLEGRAGAPASLVEAFAGLDATDREALLVTDVLGVGIEAAAAICDTAPDRLQASRHAAHVVLVERLLGASLPGGAYCRRMRERLSEQTGPDDTEAEPHDRTPAGGSSEAVAAHLRDCGDCRTYAEGLDAVLHHAPALVPPPPATLRGEVLEDLGASPTASASRRQRRILAGMSRRTAVSTAAAVGGGVLGLLVVLLLAGPPTPGDDARDRLAALAETHAGTGTSHSFDVAGDLQLRLPPGPQTPGRVALDEQLGGLGGELGAANEVEVSFRAQGETDGRGALTYELRWRLTGPLTASGVLEVVTVDERTYLRRGGEPGWALTGGSAGFDLGVVEFPHHLGEVLDTLEEVEEAATMATVGLGGASVDHLRARTSSGMVVDAWVGAEDGWLRRLRWIPAPPSDERDGSTHGEVVVRLHDHGRARFVGVPDDWQRLGDLDDSRRPPLVPPDPDRGS